MATIREIAQRSKASLGTVSNVLNDRPGPSTTTRENILRVAAEMGYRPSRQARQLRKQKNLTISVHVDSRVTSSNLWRPTFILNMLMLQGVSSFVYERGYHMHMIVPETYADAEEIEKQVLNENAVDGLIILGLALPHQERFTQVLEGLRDKNVPVVTLDHTISEKGFPIVSVELDSGFRQMVARIAQCNHSRIGYIGRTEVANNQERASRFGLFRRHLQEVGLDVSSELVYRTETELQAYRHTHSVLQQPDMPTCIFYSSDHFAMAGIEAIKESGLSIPADISVIGLDNAPYSHECGVALASIDKRYLEQGKMLAKVLLDQIDARDDLVPAVTLVGSRFMARESLGPAR